MDTKLSLVCPQFCPCEFQETSWTLKPWFLHPWVCYFKNQFYLKFTLICSSMNLLFQGSILTPNSPWFIHPWVLFQGTILTPNSPWFLGPWVCYFKEQVEPLFHLDFFIHEFVNLRNNLKPEINFELFIYAIVKF